MNENIVSIDISILILICTSLYFADKFEEICNVTKLSRSVVHRYLVYCMRKGIIEKKEKNGTFIYVLKEGKYHIEYKIPKSNRVIRGLLIVSPKGVSFTINLKNFEK